MSAYEFLTLLGDSITEGAYSQDKGYGWAAGLANAFVSRLTVVNAGVSGYNTRMALAGLPDMIPPPSRGRIRILVVFFGANDARLPDACPGTRQHVPLDEYRANLVKIVTDARIAAHDPKIVLMTPPPVDETAWERFCEEWNFPQVRRAAVTRQYAEAVREVAAEIGVGVVDLWSIFMERAGWEPGNPLLGSKEPGQSPSGDGLAGLLSDGLHLSGEGNKLVFESLKAFIKENLPEENELPWLLPRWDDKCWKDL